MNVTPFHRSRPANGPIRLPGSAESGPAARPVGPASNTGQKSLDSLSQPIIDFCTVVLDGETAIRAIRKLHPVEVFRRVFGVGGSIAVGPIQEKSWNFYPRSALLVDSTGTVAGRLGVKDDGSMCISLTGQGCTHVPDWAYVRMQLEYLAAHLTRLDIAVDDLSGQVFDIHTFLNHYDQGKFTMNGRPPIPQFVDDMGSGKGCSFYVGQKGHKQLNVYEKGKQLGDPDSMHTRCELRLYAKRLDLPLDALTNPGRYFAGSYPVLALYVIGEAERLEVKKRCVDASAKAMVKFLRTQAGTSLHCVMDAFGDEALEFLMQHVVRKGRPGRFKNTTGDLSALVRTQLSISIEKAAA